MAWSIGASGVASTWQPAGTSYDFPAVGLGVTINSGDIVIVAMTITRADPSAPLTMTASTPRVSGGLTEVQGVNLVDQGARATSSIFYGVADSTGALVVSWTLSHSCQWTGTLTVIATAGDALSATFNSTGFGNGSPIEFPTGSMFYTKRYNYVTGAAIAGWNGSSAMTWPLQADAPYTDFVVASGSTAGGSGSTQLPTGTYEDTDIAVASGVTALAAFALSGFTGGGPEDWNTVVLLVSGGEFPLPPPPSAAITGGSSSVVGAYLTDKALV